ncbi:MAG: YbaY family lipoprotein [Candidatus Competibacteraceae bacterium]
MQSMIKLGPWSATPYPKKLQCNGRLPLGMAVKHRLHRLVQGGAVTAVTLMLIGLTPTNAQAQTIQGTASYRERIALPPEAAFEATLEDVSRADAPAEVIGRTRIEPTGQVPIRFEIAYDVTRIDPKHRYSVRARITRGDTLLFTTTRIYPVLTQGAGTKVELLLQRLTKSK